MSIKGDEDVHNNETRNMWIAVAVIAAILVGGLGINMLIHHETSANSATTGHSPN